MEVSRRRMASGRYNGEKVVKDESVSWSLTLVDTQMYTQWETFNTGARPDLAVYTRDQTPLTFTRIRALSKLRTLTKLHPMSLSR